MNTISSVESLIHLASESQAPFITAFFYCHPFSSFSCSLSFSCDFRYTLDISLPWHFHFRLLTHWRSLLEAGATQHNVRHCHSGDLICCMSQRYYVWQNFWNSQLLGPLGPASFWDNSTSTVFQDNMLTYHSEVMALTPKVWLVKSATDIILFAIWWNFWNSQPVIVWLCLVRKLVMWSQIIWQIS